MSNSPLPRADVPPAVAPLHDQHPNKQISIWIWTALDALHRVRHAVQNDAMTYADCMYAMSQLLIAADRMKQAREHLGVRGEEALAAQQKAILGVTEKEMEECFERIAELKRKAGA